MNLNEPWFYDDPVDQWAAQREFDLRLAAYRRHCEGFVGAVKRATDAMEAIRIAIAGAGR